ncbi:MAG: hypothetical protein GY851_19945 [bacterium]|nr:hypothetical protein [bacterium]
MKTRSGCTEHGCGCDGDFNRREFMALAGLATGTAATMAPMMKASAGAMPKPGAKRPARVRVVFLYPSSKTFSDNPDGWWSWPGNDFDAEGRQKAYMDNLREAQEPLGVELIADQGSVGDEKDAQKLVTALREEPVDGLLLVMFYNNSLKLADMLIECAKELGLPAIFYIGLGVKHGPIASYQREGVYFIQSHENLEAIQDGLRMIATKVRLGQSLLLSVNEAEERRVGVEAFFGINVRVIPFKEYAKLFDDVAISGEDRAWMQALVDDAREVRGMTPKALDNAIRAHLALKQLIREEGADGITMNCLRRGMLKPCISFSELNSELIPAACENDLSAAYTQLIGQLLTGQPGFQHNPAYDTERNHYYGSHCTCPAQLNGPDGPRSSYLLRRFAHTNEGSCAVQVFWAEDEPVTMVRYHASEDPKLDVYAGKVVTSYPMPPVGGCTTNVAIELADRSDACMVRGHHNLLFTGDHARRFRLFARLHRLPLADTGYEGPWPG